PRMVELLVDGVGLIELLQGLVKLSVIFQKNSIIHLRNTKLIFIGRRCKRLFIILHGSIILPALAVDGGNYFIIGRNPFLVVELFVDRQATIIVVKCFWVVSQSLKGETEVRQCICHFLFSPSR